MKPTDFKLAIYFIITNNRKINAHSFVPVNEPHPEVFLHNYYVELNKIIEEEQKDLPFKDTVEFLADTLEIYKIVKGDLQNGKKKKNSKTNNKKQKEV